MKVRISKIFIFYLVVLLIPTSLSAKTQMQLNNNKITTFQKLCGDADNDGKPDAQDSDMNGDGIKEKKNDLDGDGILDNDANGDGNPGDIDDDMDNDGIKDDVDPNVEFIEQISWPNKPVGNVVRCAEKIIQAGADRSLDTYIRMFASIVYYSIILAIVLHGVRMMLGIVTDSKITIILMIKIVIVLFVCSPQGFLFIKNTRDALIAFPRNAVGGIADLIMKDFNVLTIPDVLGITTILCDPYGDGAIQGFNTCLSYPMGDVYDMIDENVLLLFGYLEEDGIENDDVTSEMFLGIVALAVLLLFSGAFGAMVGVIVITYIFAIIFAVAELVLYFLVVIIAMNFLATISPIALVCMLFKQTERITKIWFSYLMVFTVQPVVLITFIFFMMIIIKTTATTMQTTFNKIKLKFENVDGNSNMKTTLFDCLGIKGSPDQLKQDLKNTKTWDDIYNIYKTQLYYKEKQNTGNSRPEDFNDVTKPGCDISIYSLKLDNEVKLSGTTALLTNADNDKINNETGAQGADGIPDSRLTYQDMQEFLANVIATGILMMIIITFIKELPKVVGGIVGQSGTDVSGVVQRPQNFALKELNKIEYGQGIVGSIAGSIRKF